MLRFKTNFMFIASSRPSLFSRPQHRHDHACVHVHNIPMTMPLMFTCTTSSCASVA